jgi:hypothetical protein
MNQRLPAKEGAMANRLEKEEEDSGPALDRVRDALDRIHAALRGLRYGTVTAVVQDGVVVQVERTEKFRIEKRGRSE